MTYELKDYLKAINKTKEKLMDTDDKMWEKKYPPFIVNKCVAPFPDTIHLVNEMNTNFRTPGTVIAFKSYLPHEVTPVTKGERITLTYFIRGPKSR